MSKASFGGQYIRKFFNLKRRILNGKWFSLSEKGPIFSHFLLFPISPRDNFWNLKNSRSSSLIKRTSYEKNHLFSCGDLSGVKDKYLTPPN